MIALYPGAFKPPHRGHFNVVKALLSNSYTGTIYDKDDYKAKGAEILGGSSGEKPKIDKVIVFVGAGERNGITKEESMSIWKIYASHLGNVEILDGQKNPMFAAKEYAQANPDEQMVAVTGIRGEKDFVDLRRITTFKNAPNVKGLAFAAAPNSTTRATDFRNSILSGNLDNMIDFFPEDLSREQIISILTDLKDKIVAEILSSNIDGFINEYFGVEDMPLPLDEVKEYKPQYTEYIGSILEYMLDEGMNIQPLPEVKVRYDEDNAKDFFGKTAYYDPNSKEVVLYATGRHPKDICRSFTHEMVHHIQNLEGRLHNIKTQDTNEDERLLELEKEAYLTGNITFRNWEDKYKNNTDTVKEVMTEGKYDAITTYLTNKSIEGVKNALTKKLHHYKEGYFGNVKSTDAQVAMKKIVDEAYPILLLSLPDDIDKQFQKESDLEFDYELKAIFVKGSDAIMRNGGAYKGGLQKDDSWIQPKIELEFVLDPYNFPRDFEELSAQISDVLRHEIEHLTQAGGNERGKTFGKDAQFGGIFGTDKEMKFRTKIANGDIKNGYKYLTIPSEIDANIQGLYLSAKKSKRPFKDVVDQYLYDFTEQYDDDGNPFLTKQEVEDVKKVWSLRLPSLGIKQKL